MKKHKKEIRFVAATILLILVIVFCMTETVKSQDNTDRRVQNQYYAAMEKEYVSALCSELDSRGYHNSGITVRWTTEEDGTRCYTVMIHHGWISDLDTEEITELTEALAKAEFEDVSCSFYYEFIT